MRKILIAGVVMLASLAQAEVLSWRVDVASGNGFYTSAQLYATLQVTADKDAANTITQGSSIGRYSIDYGVLTTDTALTVNSSYNFFVALVDGATVNYSALMTWDQLVDMGALWSGTLPAPMGTTSWNAVPEPTSMALLALGVSAMLLRRKRTV
jgi:PEP-CTERM motif